MTTTPRFVQALEPRRLLSVSPTDPVEPAAGDETGEFLETWVPYVPSADHVGIEVVQQDGQVRVNVTITFSSGGYRVTDWGTPRREGNHFIVDAKVERWTGPATQAMTTVTHEYPLGQLDPGEYAFHFKAWNDPVRSKAFAVHGETPSEQWIPYTPTEHQTSIEVFEREGRTYARVKIVFPDSGFRVDWRSVTRDGNTFRADAVVDRWTGPALTVITPMSHLYDLGGLAPGEYAFEFAARGTLVERKTFAVHEEPEWEPYTPTAEQTEIEVFQDDHGHWRARVTLTFTDNGFRVADWGTVKWTEDGFVADAKVERTPGVLPVITHASHVYELGLPDPGEHAFHFKAWGKLVESKTFVVPEPSEEWAPYTPTAEQTEIALRESDGKHVALVTITFAHTGFRVDWGTLVREGNTFSADGKVDRHLGPAPAVVTPKHHEYLLGTLEPGTYTFEFTARGEPVENITFTVPGEETLVFDALDADDRFHFSTDEPGHNILLAWNNEPSLRPPSPWPIPRDAYDRFLINAHGGDDAVVIDLVQHTPLPHHGMVYNGGSGNDVLQVTNAGATDRIEIVGDRVVINGIVIELTSVERIVVDRSTGSDVSVGGSDVVELDAGQHVDSITLTENAVLRLTGDAPQVTLSALSLSDDALLDLRDKTVLISVEASQVDETLATLHELIAAGRADGWTGARGITSSLAATDTSARDGVGVAVIGSPLLASLSSGADVQVIALRYTLEGDLNLDGLVNADDYFRIDSGFLAQPPSPTYAEGDVNYDRRVNADDYFLIDSAFLTQSGALNASGALASSPAILASADHSDESELRRKRSPRSGAESLFSDRPIRDRATARPSNRRA